MEIKVPDLGVDSAEVSEIMVNVGDVINVDDNIVLLESDKASVEVPATSAGKVIAINIQPGDKVKEGDVILTVDGAASTQSTIATDTPTTQTADPADNLAALQPVSAPNQPKPTSATTQTTYPLPDLGVESAQISEWLVQVGDDITAEQPLLLIESDKASVEVPAPATGKVIKLLVNAGDTVKRGQDFIVIEAGTPASTLSQIESWAVSSDVSSQPDTNTAPSQAQVATPASSHPSDQPNTVATSTAMATSTTVTTLSEAQINAKHANVYAGPAVRKLTRQLGVDISEVTGSGAHGRIVKEDIFAFVKNKMQVLNAPTASNSSSNAEVRSGLPNLPDMSKTEIWGEIAHQDLTRLQKVSIPQLNYNTYLPQVTQFDLADITDVEALRRELKDELKKEGISLTILAFIMKVTAYALMQHPKFNSHLSDDNTQLIIRKTVNLGFAVATDEGLTVPVIQDVQQKGIKQLAIEIGQLAKKARDKKLSAKELTGASFTISSQGNLGGTYFTPLVNWPQVAILGVSESSIQPRWNVATQSFEPRLMLPLSLSYDHRVINGADAAVFTRYIATLLADPRRVLL